MKIGPTLLFVAAAIIMCTSMMPKRESGPEVGKLAPDFTATDQDGRAFNLKDYRGKVVVLDFWGSWCLPCVQLIPHNEEMVREWEHEPFALIGVNSDGDRDTANELFKKEGVTYRNALDGTQTGPIAKLYEVDGWPAVYVLDRDGVVRHKYVGVDPDELKQAVQEELRRP